MMNYFKTMHPAILTTIIMIAFIAFITLVCIYPVILLIVFILAILVMAWVTIYEAIETVR